MQLLTKFLGLNFISNLVATSASAGAYAANDKALCGKVWLCQTMLDVVWLNSNCIACVHKCEQLLITQ